MLGIRNGSLITPLLLCGSFSLLIGLRFLCRRLSSTFIACHVFRISFKLLIKRCNFHYENLHLSQSSVLLVQYCMNCINMALDDWSTNLVIIILVSCYWSHNPSGYLIHSLTVAGVSSTGFKVNTLKQIWVLWHYIKESMGNQSLFQLIQHHFSFWNDLIQNYWLD